MYIYVVFFFLYIFMNNWLRNIIYMYSKFIVYIMDLWMLLYMDIILKFWECFFNNLIIVYLMRMIIIIGWVL